jgi:hypothetical protein
VSLKVTLDPKATEGGGKMNYSVSPNPRTGVNRIHDVRMTIVAATKERVINDVLPHEVQHLINASICGDQPGFRWIDEGSASVVEKTSTYFENALDKALRTGRAFPTSELWSYRDYPKRDVDVFYGQSESNVRFLLCHVQDSQSSRQKFSDFMIQGYRTKDWSKTLKDHYHYSDLKEFQDAWISWYRSGRILPQDEDPEKITANFGCELYWTGSGWGTRNCPPGAVVPQAQSQEQPQDRLKQCEETLLKWQAALKERDALLAQRDAALRSRDQEIETLKSGQELQKLRLTIAEQESIIQKLNAEIKEQSAKIVDARPLYIYLTSGETPKELYEMVVQLKSRYPIRIVKLTNDEVSGDALPRLYYFPTAEGPLGSSFIGESDVRSALSAL